MEKFLDTDPNFVQKISENGGYEYIIVGSGFGGGILANELASRGKKVLLIERGGLEFSTHVCNTARPSFARGKNDSPEGNETIYNNLKSWVQPVDGSEPYVGGPLYCLGGRSVVWGLWIPPTPDKTLHSYFPEAIAQDLQSRYFRKAFDLVTNGSQDPETPYPEGQVGQAFINKAKGKITQAVEFYDASEVVTGPTATEFKADVYRFPQGAYSTVEDLLNRLYSRDPNLTVLMHAEVLDFEHIENPSSRDDEDKRLVPALNVRLTGSDSVMKIYAKGAQVILSAGTLCTAQIALNSGLQVHNDLVGKGLSEHAVYAARYAMQRSAREPTAPLLLQTLININDTSALLTVTINYNFLLAGSSHFPIHQYLGCKRERSGTPRLIELEDGELVFGRNANSFDTIAILIEYGAPLDDRNMVLNTGAPHPVIRFKREHTYNDEDSLINMQILTTRIRNAVAKHIIFGMDEDISLLTAIEAIAAAQVKVDTTDSDSTPGGDDLETLGELMKAISTELTPRPDLLGCGIYAHEVGTMRMDNPNAGNPITGVVDENLKVHGFSNLHVCDLSVFPYSVESNPSITLAALSLRLAEHLSPSNEAEA